MPPFWNSSAQLSDTDPHRLRDVAWDALGLYVDFGKRRVTRETIRLLSELARPCGLWVPIVEHTVQDIYLDPDITIV